MLKIPTFLALTASALLCQCETTKPDFASSDDGGPAMAAVAEVGGDCGTQRTRQWVRAVSLMREHAQTMEIGAVAAVPGSRRPKASSTHQH